jgi:hypothetical protein
VIQKERVKKRPPNWIPISRPLKKNSEEIVVSQEDLFPKGEVVKFLKENHSGLPEKNTGKWFLIPVCRDIRKF